ncbi:SRPBCC domain-containing protein [Paenarthrobacter nitroguajacolicus]|uniref:SRPBCC domain-containing protein n=1 Tax=Paenarthrobacter nitroguajacolicus TaxID=211146 RepID=UPI00248C12C1|nr:SRPBCC domain-containing protein [Paenarthrobacter nitroguajacolicus]
MSGQVVSGQAADAVASTTIVAGQEQVWEALTDPALIKQYFLGTNVTTTWKTGDPITYSGEYNGKEYEDKGTVLVFEPPVRLKNTHFSPSSGLADTPENHHTVEYALAAVPGGTTVTITQGNNRSQEEVASSTAMWQQVLGNLKEFLESRS